MRYAVLCLLFVILAGLAGEAPAFAKDAPSAWENEALLQDAFQKGCTAVSAFCGIEYPETPTLKVSTVAEVREILKAEFASAREDMAEVEQTSGDQMLEAIATGLLAKYEPSTNTVHVLSKNVGRLARLVDMPAIETEAVMRVVIAHEAVHALDFLRFPNLEAGLNTLTVADERIALSAVLEGHAQYVSRAIAASWGLEDAWQIYTASITAEVPGLTGALRLVAQTMAAGVAFAYIQGYTFMTAVAEARGREGLDAALAAPPTSTRMIERPELWLDPSLVVQELSLEAALGPLRVALEEVGCSTTIQRLLDAQLRVQLGMFPPDEADHAMGLFDEAQVLVAQSQDPVIVVFAAVMRMTDVASARAWRGVTKKLSLLKDESFATGPIQVESAEYEDLEHEPGSPALRVVKMVKTPAVTQRVELLCYPVSRYVIELTTIDVSDEVRASIQTAVERTIAVLRAPELLEAPTPSEAPDTPDVPGTPDVPEAPQDSE